MYRSQHSGGPDELNLNEAARYTEIDAILFGTSRH